MQYNLFMRKGFTLLELIIVIIIVGVLASVALPKLFSVIEGSRATEALVAIGTLRSSIERCYLMNSGSYENCGFNSLDIESPTQAAGSHFKYGLGTSARSYCIIAYRIDPGGKYSGHLITMGFGCDAPVSQDGIQCTPNYLEDDKFHWDAAKIYKPFVPK